MTVSDQRDQRDLVSALLGVPGVAAAAVEPVGGGPGTLRLQLAPGADEVGVAGAVNHLLRSRFGLAVDADRVRVLDQPEPPHPRRGEPHAGPEPTGAPSAAAPAEGGAEPVVEQPESAQPESAQPEAEQPEAEQPEVEEPRKKGPPKKERRPPREQQAEQPAPEPIELPPVPATRPGRLVIERVQLVSAGLGTSVTVSLGLDGRSFDGSAEGTATTGSLLRSVAGATLRAVEAVIGGDARFDVEHVEVAATGTERTALAVVTMVTGRATQRLSGASVVREDVRQAVIRAVLAAVNRRLEPMLTALEGARS
ncbi:MAG TPA: hypothetical protein VF227_07960 [Actinomycetes bacterium]